MSCQFVIVGPVRNKLRLRTRCDVLLSSLNWTCMNLLCIGVELEMLTRCAMYKFNRFCGVRHQTVVCPITERWNLAIFVHKG